MLKINRKNRISNVKKQESKPLHYEINVSEKGIESIVDKEFCRELIKKGNVFSQLIYDYGEPFSSLPNPLPNYFLKLLERGPNSYKRYVSKNYKIVEVKNGKVYSSIKLRSKTKNCPFLETEIIAYNKIKKLEIVNKLKKVPTYEKEGVYFAFPFSINGNIYFEVPGATIEIPKNLISGACKDWFAVKDFILLKEKDFGIVFVPVDAPVVRFSDANNGLWIDEINFDGTIYSYIMNNYWFTNFKAMQGGNYIFRYYIGSGNIAQEEARKFGEGCLKPLTPIKLNKNKNGFLGGEKFSFIKIENENVKLVTFKKSEDCRGYIIRLRETMGKNANVKIELPFKFKEIYLCDIVENEKIKMNNRKIMVNIRPYDIVTLKLVK